MPVSLSRYFAEVFLANQIFCIIFHLFWCQKFFCVVVPKSLCKRFQNAEIFNAVKTSAVLTIYFGERIVHTHSNDCKKMFSIEIANFLTKIDFHRNSQFFDENWFSSKSPVFRRKVVKGDKNSDHD
jgi:hypothetical protein